MGKGSKRNGKTFTILRRTLKDFGKNFSQGADRLADICVESNGKGKTNKGKRLGKETIHIFKNLAAYTKYHLKDLSFKGMLCDTSYKIGQFSKIAKNKGRKIIKDIL